MTTHPRGLGTRIYGLGLPQEGVEVLTSSWRGGTVPVHGLILVWALARMGCYTYSEQPRKAGKATAKAMS